MKINNVGIFVVILPPVSTQLIRTSDSDQNSGARLVFRLSEKTERKTNPKSEVTQCFAAHSHSETTKCAKLKRGTQCSLI